MTFECYSQRLLNPFRGCINCIRYRSAEAVTADGAHWDIYVSNEGLLDGLEAQHRPQISDIRFGSWSAARGLKRGPMYPSGDFRRMERLGQIVFEHLLKMHEQVPFPFLDSHELWLLDRQQQPLALLDSALSGEEIRRDQSLQWIPGQDCRRSFSTRAAHKLELDKRPGAVADYLTHYVNSLTTQQPSAQLFRRLPDGRGFGRGGIDIDPGLATRTLPASAFPARLLTSRGHDALHTQLIEDFIRWQAPWQLLLAMDVQQRGLFEEHARVQPQKVASQYRLYPEIVRTDIIDAARVEARLRATLPQQNQPEQIMSPFYIELGPETGNE